MPSSISPPTSSNRRRGAVLWAGVVGAPVLWLALLQTNYVLAYPACAERTNAWLHSVTAAAMALMVLVAIGAVYVWRTDPPEQRTGPARFDEQHDPIGEDPSRAARHFAAMVALLLSGLFVLLVAGTWIPSFVLHPCD